MVYDPGALHVALAAAVGDDPQLIAELRGVFLESATALVKQLKRTRIDTEWQMAAIRLHGLAASFGAVALMEAAAAASDGIACDPVSIRAIDEAIAAFDC